METITDVESRITMARIFYGLCGEGRGHASRARIVIENLRGQHDFTVFTSHDAYAFLREVYANSADVDVHRVEGLRFHYSRGRLDLPRTLRSGFGFRVTIDQNLRAMQTYFDREQPDLVLSDFEPLVAHAAHRNKLPVVSLDHQHFLLAYELSSLPCGLRRYATAMRWLVRAHGIRPDHTIISAFFRPPLRAGYEHVLQVGPLLRPEVRSLDRTEGDYVLSYLRKATPPAVLERLKGSGARVKIYGLGERPASGNLSFHTIDHNVFVRDLAGCRGVIAAAGNQLLGESLYFGKPFLALPERRHHEQRINAHFLEQLGGGREVIVEDLQAVDVVEFLRHLDIYHKNLAGRQQEFDGTDKTVKAIRWLVGGEPALSTHSPAA